MRKDGGKGSSGGWKYGWGGEKESEMMKHARVKAGEEGDTSIHLNGRYICRAHSQVDWAQAGVNACSKTWFCIQVYSSCPPPCPCNTVQLFLPIQTSPNWPLPSFLISWRDSRGISHISLVFTDKSASLGMPRLQLPIKRQHRPATLSDRERWYADRWGIKERSNSKDKEKQVA